MSFESVGKICQGNQKRNREYSVKNSPEQFSDFENNRSRQALPEKGYSLHNKLHQKRHPFSIPVWEKGSITLEASLILPLFIMVFTAFLFFFQVMFLQSRLQRALDETAQSLSSYLYLEELLPEKDINTGKDDDISSKLIELAEKLGISALEGAYVKIELLKNIDQKWLDQSVIKGGSSGILCYGETFFQNGENVDLRIVYTVKIPFFPDEWMEKTLTQRSVRRIWNGYCLKDENESQTAQESEDSEGEEASEDSREGDTSEDYRIYYGTEKGSVYHLYADCQSIKREVSMKTYGEVKSLRNEDGSIYYACKHCVKKEMEEGDYVFISKYGTLFHTDRTCSALNCYANILTEEEKNGRTLCKFCEEREKQEIAKREEK